MRITILTFGTQGDVRPFVALAVGLQQASYEVMLVAPANFEGLATEYDVPYAPIGVHQLALMRTDQFKEMPSPPLPRCKAFQDAGDAHVSGYPG